MISFSEDFDVTRSPSEAFSLIDDFQRTPEWNARCVEVKQTSEGPRAVGSALRYKYKDPGRVGEMDGTITAYQKDREIAMRYRDRMLDVSVKFAFAPAGSGTRVHHEIAIEPKSFLAKLMTPIIRGATRKQTADTVARLKKLLTA